MESEPAPTRRICWSDSARKSNNLSLLSGFQTGVTLIKSTKFPFRSTEQTLCVFVLHGWRWLREARLDTAWLVCLYEEDCYIAWLCFDDDADAVMRLLIYRRSQTKFYHLLYGDFPKPRLQCCLVRSREYGCCMSIDSGKRGAGFGKEPGMVWESG